MLSNNNTKKQKKLESSKKWKIYLETQSALLRIKAFNIPKAQGHV
jgi:hypothetical protein